MPPNDLGPPEKERPSGSQAARPIDKSGPHQDHQPTPAYNKHRQSGCYAAAWRHGFGHGFRDALRLAARRLPPETWRVLDELATDYELAGTGG
jgi:hypothetical protein